MRRFCIKALHDKLLEAERRRGKAQVCVPCNADCALAEPVGEAVTSARALKFWNASAVAVALGTASFVLRF